MASTPVDKFRETAKETAKKRFDSLLGTTPDYWKCANAFDTMVDYLEYCIPHPPIRNRKTMTMPTRQRNG